MFATNELLVILGMAKILNRTSLRANFFHFDGVRMSFTCLASNVYILHSTYLNYLYKKTNHLYTWPSYNLYIYIYIYIFFFYTYSITISKTLAYHFHLEHSQQWCYIGILLYFSSSNTKIMLQQWS